MVLEGAIPKFSPGSSPRSSHPQYFMQPCESDSVYGHARSGFGSIHRGIEPIIGISQ